MNEIVKLKTVYREDASLSGAACLSMILSWFGRDVSPEELKQEYQPEGPGFSAGSIKRAAAHHGLQCAAFQTEPENYTKSLPAIPTPSILLITYDVTRFVILEQVTEWNNTVGENVTMFCVNDPMVGRRLYDLPELMALYKGIYLTFKPEDNFYPADRYEATDTFCSQNMSMSGANCLAMILSHFGTEASPEKIYREIFKSAEFFRASDIKQASEEHFRLECKGYKKSAEELPLMPVPCILHWDSYTFVVLNGFISNDIGSGRKDITVHVTHPRHGRLMLTLNELSRHYSGTVLTFRAAKEYWEYKEAVSKLPRLRDYWRD